MNDNCQITAPSASAPSKPAKMAGRRLKRELKTIHAMLRLFCRDHHGQPEAGDFCADCQGLMDYVLMRLDRCPFGTDKPNCSQCPIHCYKPERRKEIVGVMRYSGPRLIWHRPLLTLRHLLNGRRARPAHPRGRSMES